MVIQLKMWKMAVLKLSYYIIMLENLVWIKTHVKCALIETRISSIAMVRAIVTGLVIKRGQPPKQLLLDSELD